MGTVAVVELVGLEALFEELRRRGLVVVGPTRRDGVVVLDELASWQDLPAGWGDVQEPGVYRLASRGDGAIFGYANGPQSWKRLLFPPREQVLRVELGGIEPGDGAVPVVEAAPLAQPRYAFVGVRACDLAAIAILDRVFLGGAHRDGRYEARRRPAFLVAVNCSEPGGTCFCASMGTGPGITGGFDLAITEVLEPDHHLVVEAGTAEGEAVLAGLPGRPPTSAEIAQAEAVVTTAAGRMGRAVDVSDLPGLLADRPEHPRWQEVAQRCLACANCTMVCPTCFCSVVEDTTDVTGEHAERWREWDSCFTLDFSFIHGGSVRVSTLSRYRQWLTHKLDTWHDQFGMSGCVGCGRCITWCPVGIDLTEEVSAVRAEPAER